MTLDELRAEKARLWEIYEVKEREYKAALNDWCLVNDQIEKIEAKAKLRAELLAEMESEKAVAK
jgi:hypothetical protein